MSRIPNVNTFAPPSNGGQADALGEINLDAFLNLMIAELQNQDPLDPLDNSEMLQQITQIREIGATDQLRGTLDTLLLGQNLNTAAGLLGKEVNGLTATGDSIQGVVDRVSIAADEDSGQRTIRVLIGETEVPLKNIREITS